MTPKDFGCKCEECPFSKAGAPAKDFVLPEGPRSPKGVVFTDVPMTEEARRGSPLAANTQLGAEWDKSLKQAGLGREDLLHVPATACPRPHGVKEESKTPKAITACAPMRAEAKRLMESGVPTISLGKWGHLAATEQAKGHDGQRGFVSGNYTTTYRPMSAYFWQPHTWANFDIDVLRFGRMIRGELALDPALQLGGPMAPFFARARAEGWIAFDIETMPVDGERPWTGKDPTQARLRTVSLGWENQGGAWFVEDMSDADIRGLRQLLADPTILKVGLNIVFFDIRVLKRHGFPVVNFADCRDMRRAISSTSRLSLAYQTTTYTDAPAWKTEKDEGSEDVQK